MRKLEALTALSSKGQIVIPKELRKALGLRAGDRFKIEVENNKLILRSVSKTVSDWRTLEGAFGPVDQTTAEILAEGRAKEFARDREE